MLTTPATSYDHHNVFCPTAGTYSSYYSDALRSTSRRGNKRVSLLRRKSSPAPAPVPEKNTDHKAKKSVRFSDDSDQIRFFYQWQAPKDDKKEYRLELVNSKKVQKRSAIALETIALAGQPAPKLSVVGKCRVDNLAFEKHVMVRYTFDNWETHTDLDATYRESLADLYKDLFTFEFDTEKIDECDDLTLQFALCYCVNGHEFWDNNDGDNYSARLYRQPAVENITRIDKEKVAPWSPAKRGSPSLSNATFINPWSTSSFWIAPRRFTEPHDQPLFSHPNHLSRGPMPLIS